MSGNTQDNAAVASSIASPRVKLLVVVILSLVALILSYSFAVARGSEPAGGSGSGLLSQASDGGYATSGGSGGGDGCCGGGGPAVEGATVVEGDVQRIAVDTSTGSFAPNVIKAKAGVPIVIDFSQAPGGCLSGVYFPDFGIDEDLTGGAKTIELPALDPGEYTFYCQMQMVSAKIVVE